MTSLANSVLSGFTLHQLLSTAEALISLAVLCVLAMSAWRRYQLKLTRTSRTYPVTLARFAILALLSGAARLHFVFSTIRTRTKV
jgi:hypothetical protein